MIVLAYDHGAWEMFSKVKSYLSEKGLDYIECSSKEYDGLDSFATFAKEAKEEGFDHIAFLFSEVAKIEKEHEERFRKLLDNIEKKVVFSRDGDAIWECGNCGHIVIGKDAPEMCPVCEHPQSYFRLRATNY